MKIQLVIRGEGKSMDHEGYEKAANYWQIKDIDNVKMESTKLLQAMETYIQQNNTCALATGSGEFVRCTPIEYVYDEGAFWLFSEGGVKFKALEKNKNVCLAIFNSYEGFSNLKGMQVTGTAELVAPFSDLYIKIAAVKKIPIEALKKLSEPMHLIKIKPIQIEYLNAAFKKEGYASRQMITFN